MDSFQQRLKSLIVKLHEIDALKFGDFKMKVGINSPVYFDLRVIVSYPTLMDSLSRLLWEFSHNALEPFDHICGVPYTALPIASLISVQANMPMLIRRKESKDYGTKKLIEGKFKMGDRCLIIEDVVTSGSSILDTFKDLRNEGLSVSEAIVVVDREQGGAQNLLAHGVKMKSLCTLSQIMNILYENNRVKETVVDQVKTYISATQIPLGNYAIPTTSKYDRLTMNYSQRANLTKCNIASKLFHIMMRKSSNLCLSADVTSMKNLLDLATQVGPYICLLKIHVDILKDFHMSSIEKLVSIAREKEFLILEDRKFADIGHIVNLQYSQGLYNIANWADFVTVHPLPGPGILEGLKEVDNAGNMRGCFVVVEMSSQGNLHTSDYKKGAVTLAGQYPDFVCGIVSQTASMLPDPGLIQLTPGVQLVAGKDGLGQQYNSPENVILERGADIAVVGRGIIGADDIVEMAQEFQSRLWKAYEKRIGEN